MSFVPAILYHLGVRSAVGLIGTQQDPQSMDELVANYKFDQTSPPFTWAAYCAKRDEIYKERAIIRVRRYRNEELKNTDWVEIPSNATTIENISEILEYRQKLRDLPSTVSAGYWIFNGTIPALDMVKMGVPQRPVIRRKNNSS